MSQGSVLLVEDEKDYLNLMFGHLKRRGYEVTTANNGREAYDLLNNGGSFDVLVTDLMMPEMGGVELLRKARALDENLMVLVISGAGTLESAISAMREDGAFNYLVKPLDTIRDLSLAVEKALDYRQLKMEKAELQNQVALERERLKTVMENTTDAILSADANDQIQVINPSAAEMLSLSSNGDLSASQALPNPLLAILDNWKNYEADESITIELPWPSNQVSMVHLTNLEEKAGSSQGWIMVLRDITEHKHLAELKMRFLTRAADKMRGPLADAVSTLVELNELPEAKSEAYTASIEQMMNELSSIRAWTDDLFELVQTESRSEYEFEAVQLAEIAADSERYLSDGLVNEKGLDLELEVTETLDISGNEDLIKKLLQQLVRQAAWRAPRASTLHLTVRDSNNQVWVEVRDDGQPILESEAPIRFEKFFADSDARVGTTGLELAVAKSIADRIGGQIWVWFEENEGNVFAVSFPAIS